MRMLKPYCLCLGMLMLQGCSPVKIPEANQYQLSAFSSKAVAKHGRKVTLQVTLPEAVSAYQTQQMLYIKKPFQLESFAKNAWKSPPADMIYPLLVESLQQTHYFFAVSSSLYTEETDYRLDTQILSLEQNFLMHPSVLHFSAKVVLVRVSDSRVLGSRIVNLQIPCPSDTPYGGVLAANRAMQQFTSIVTDFAISHIN